MIKRSLTMLVLALLGIGAVQQFFLPAYAQNPKRAAPTAKPPKWEKRVLDAFFADARKHLGPGRPGGTTAVSQGNTSAAGTTSVAAGSTLAVAGGINWSKMIDAEVLEAEIKTNINLLTPAVAVPGNFKSQTYKKARVAFSELAVLFGVIVEYDGDVKWKSRAAGMRELLAKAGANCKVGTDQSFKEAKGRAEDLKQLLDGGSVEVPQAESKAEWAKVADRPELMKRMEEAGQHHLTPWTANAADFKSNKDKIVHEAQVLAVLAQVIQHNSYEFADDEGYRNYASALQKACLEIVEGAKAGDAEKARTAAGNMAKACANCHTDFRQ